MNVPQQKGYSKVIQRIADFSAICCLIEKIRKLLLLTFGLCLRSNEVVSQECLLNQSNRIVRIMVVTYWPKSNLVIQLIVLQKNLRSQFVNFEFTLFCL